MIRQSFLRRLVHTGRRWRPETKSTNGGVFSALGEWIYGSDAVVSALTSGRRKQAHRLYVLSTEYDDDPVIRKSNRARETSISLAEHRMIPVEYVNRNQIDVMSGQRPSNGIVLDADPIDLEIVDSLPILDIQKGNIAPIWVALDQIVDPQNLGAILRSCSFFGITGVVICGRNSAPLSPTVAKASCGALEFINIKSCRSMPKFLHKCRPDWNIIGMSVCESAVSWKQVKRDSAVPTLLVLGSEGTGLRPLVKDQCALLAKLERQSNATDNVDSLNVATAAGIALYHLSAR